MLVLLHSHQSWEGLKFLSFEEVPSQLPRKMVVVILTHQTQYSDILAQYPSFPGVELTAEKGLHLGCPLHHFLACPLATGAEHPQGLLEPHLVGNLVLGVYTGPPVLLLDIGRQVDIGLVVVLQDTDQQVALLDIGLLEALLDTGLLLVLQDTDQPVVLPDRAQQVVHQDSSFCLSLIQAKVAFHPLYQIQVKNSN